MKLICADIDGPLSAIPACTQGVQWVLVRLHGYPMGIVETPKAGCSPAELLRIVNRDHGDTISRHIAGDNLGQASGIEGLADLSQPCPRHVSPRAHVTVAVCTRNGALRLGECLDALVALDYPDHLLDLLVIDNAPSDASTRDLVGRYPRVRYVREPRPGLDWARNTAVREARGEIVAFTDDDVSVDPRWVSAIATAFEEEPHAMCVTGLVVPDELDTPAQLLFELYGGFGRGFRRWVFVADRDRPAARSYGGAGRFGTGANMAYRREFFEREGLFDPALDVGTPTNGGGDLEMFFRVLKRGHALVYDPAAMVRHRHRREYAELREQIANNGIGFSAYLMRTMQAYPDERLGVLRLAAWWFWWWYVRRLLRGIVRPAGFPRDLILAELRGAFAGWRRYAAGRRSAARVLGEFGGPMDVAGDAP